MVLPYIESIEAILVDLPTIRAHQLAMTVMNVQTLVIVRLRCSDGIEGLGEATTIGGLSYGEESPEGIKVAIDTYLAPALLGQNAANVLAAVQRMEKAARGNTFAKSALETALLDAQGKRLGVPVSTLLGGAVRDTVPVLWTLASGDTRRDIEEAEALRARILLLGMPVEIQRAEVNGLQVNRVRVGPFARLDDMNRTRARLAQENIVSTVVRQ